MERDFILCVVLWCGVVCCAVCYCVVLYYGVVCCVLCCSVVWCGVLCRVVLCCVVLCCDELIFLSLLSETHYEYADTYERTPTDTPIMYVHFII